MEHNNRVIEISQSSAFNVSKGFGSLPYVPSLGEKIKRILRDYNIDTCFQSVRPISISLSSGKHLTREYLVSGVYKY